MADPCDNSYDTFEYDAGVYGPSEACISNINIKTPARDLIEIQIDSELILNAAFRNVSNYIIQTTDSSLPLTVRNILVPQKKNTTDTILLHVDKHVAGQEYILTANNLVTRDNITVSFSGKFIADDAKVNNMIAVVPKHFNLDPNSSDFRHLLQAFTYSDDQIGGAVLQNANIITGTNPVIPDLIWDNIIFANIDGDRLFWYETTATMTGPFGANIPAVMTISGTKYLQCWSSRTNLITRNVELDIDGSGNPWGLFNGATVTADVVSLPNGESGADRVNFDADANSFINNTFGLEADFDDNVNTKYSVFHRVETGTDVWRAWGSSKAGASSSLAVSTSTTWSRYNRNLALSTGSFNPSMRLRNDGDALARSVYFTLAQMEGGQNGIVHNYAGPPIRTLDASKTRPADIAYADYVPSYLYSGTYTVKVLIDWLTGELNSNERRYVFYRNASNYLAFVESGGSVFVRLATTAGIIQRSFTANTNAARPYILTLVVDFAGGSITISGAQTGDGTTTGTVGDWPYGRIYIGSDSDILNHCDGAIGEPVET